MNLFTRHWTLFSMLVLLAGAAWTWASKAPPGSTTSGDIPAPRQGFLAPDFTLQTESGTSFQLSALRGRPVLINLWASWCGPCKAEMPAIQRVYDTYKDQGLQVLAVNATHQDSPEQAMDFARHNGLTFPILLDNDGRVSAEYELQALPTSFFVGSDGIIQEVVIGGPMSEALLRIRVENLLATRPR